MAAQKSRLGRGLDSLVSSKSPALPAAAPEAVPASRRGPAPGSIQFISVEKIQPNPLQPRSDFNRAELSGLVDSLRTSGLLQPILVRRHDSSFQIIAGERRWRAAQQAGLQTIPAIIREAQDTDMLELALIENLQRSDLNPIDRGAAYGAYMSRLGLTQEQASHRLGQDRATIANYVRLLDLDEQVRQLLAKGEISMGHARALLALAEGADQLRLAKLVSSKNLSVRHTENLIRQARNASLPKPKQVEALARQANLRELEEKVSHRLGRRVRIRCTRDAGKGDVVISFTSLDDFDDLIAKLCQS